MQKIISIKNGVTRMPEWRMAEPVNFEACDGEHIAIVGPNGGGKSMFVDIIVGRHPLLMHDPDYDFSPSQKTMVSDNIKYITFRDTYGGDNDRTYFLQQRWNQLEIDENTPIVKDKLEEAYQMAGEDTPERRALQQHIYELFHMQHLMDKYTILLSSGELRKFKLASTLFSEPRVLIMDNPFIGLDAETRDQLKELLKTLSSERALQIILVLSKSDDIPDFITHVVEVKDMKVLPKVTLAEYLAGRESVPAHVLSPELEQAIVDQPYSDREYHTQEVVKMNKVRIQYGERIILNDLDWTVMNGERWALSGQNGAGKSTLLSLVCADNPQSYACDITLFDNPRGSGESIWDIKKHIGYVSPELHRSYQRDLPAIRIVASGLMDSVGLYVKPKEEDMDKCRFWMKVFGLEGLEDRGFLKLSSGEQRLVLLARAFVKDPELLILDEPLHGLDNRNRRLVKDVIEAFCRRQNKTMIMVTHYKEELPACIDHSIFLLRHTNDLKKLIINNFRKMRYIILLFALTLSIAKASAQDVLNEVLRTSDAIINDTTKSMDERRTALFKFDAMTYMRSKILPPYVMLDKNLSKDTLNVKVRYLNEQAYAMSVYITLYQKRLKEASKKNKPLVTQFFKQATIDHKAFKDEDTEFTLAYYNTPDVPTPFCLDCDWVSTLAFIRSIDWSKL